MSGTRLFAVVVALVLLAGCGLRIPADPDGTLDRVSGQTLTVGVSHNPPWTDISGDEDPTGIEPELMTEFAESLDAEVQWVIGGEERLMALLDDGDVDVVIGGLTESAPWQDVVALTVAYTQARGADGEIHNHVVAVPPGENAFMVELETFLLAQDVSP